MGPGARRRLAEALRAGRMSGADAKRGFITSSAGMGSGFEASGANKPDRAVGDFEKCAVCGGGLHSSTSQLNLSRFGHTSPCPPV